MDFRPHHVALTVKDIGRSIRFYSYFGFKKVFYTETDSFYLAHLLLDGFFLELFSFKDTEIKEENLSLWEDLRKKGYRHLAFQVRDIHRTLERMKRDGVADGDTEVGKGRSGILYFFVKDPDGNFVEVVQDDRRF
ncbi:MAG: VOC family protein [Aquificae bacterium]|nr:VOC family protein [Aquificota bacterium]